MTKLIGLLLKVNYFMGLDVGLSGFGCSLTHPVKVNVAKGPIFQRTIAQLTFKACGLLWDVHLLGKSCRNG